MDTIKIGKFIYEERKKQKLSQDDLADILGVSRQAISKWECGKGMPDYSIMSDLCKILKISPNELLAATKENKTTEKIVANIPVEILKEDKKKLKKYIIIFSIIIILILVLFFIYYFFETYNQVKIYKLSYEDEKYRLSESMLILSSEDIYLNMGNIKSDNSIALYELYYIKDNNKISIYKSTDLSTLIIQNNGYNEYIDLNDKEYIFNGLYIDITYLNNNIEQTDTIKLNINEIYRNNKLFFLKTEEISNNIETNYNKEPIKIPDKIKNKFIYNNGLYILKKDNITIEYNPEISFFVLTLEEDDKKITLYYNSLDKYFIFDIFQDLECIVQFTKFDNEISCTIGNCEEYYDKEEELEKILEDYIKVTD